MREELPLFKHWVPEWLIKITMFLVLLPSLVLFFLPLSNVNAAAGHYGSEPLDIQYSVVLFYAGYASFFSLERRFFNYIATKEYFFIFTFIQILTLYICYLTQEIVIIFILRFIQGMCFTSTVNLSLALIFNRLHTERAREISYSVFFGMLVCMIPFDNFITAELIDAFNFNIVYKCAMISYIASILLLGITMNNVRLNTKLPLYQLDWASFVIYASFLCIVGYVLTYGQEYYWLEDKRIFWSVITVGFLLLIYIVRQLKLKRPYFNMAVFKYRNFIIGGLLLFVFYICRFSFALTPAYLNNVLGLDPIHVSYLTLFNIIGIVIGVIVSCAFVLQKRHARVLWLYGFTLLFIFHFWMFFLFNTQANEDEFFIPLVIQGLGVGFLMTPTIIYMIAAVPIHLSATAAGISLFVRCFGFYVNIAFLNYFELLAKGKHFNRFQDAITQLNPIVRERFLKHGSSLSGHGVYSSQTVKMTNRLLVKAIDAQDMIRYAMDYYEMISCMLIVTIL